jgi:hypothetical protein
LADGDSDDAEYWLSPHFAGVSGAVYRRGGGDAVGAAWKAVGARGGFGLAGLFALESATAFPNYIAYFNPLGPPERAYEHLVDSNLDWGQDLPGLSRWLGEHNSGAAKQPVYLAYFGNGRPAYYGIEAVPLPPPVDIRRELPLAPGLYCISATSLQAVYEDAPGRWNKAYEEKYQSKQRLFARLAEEECETDEKQCELTPAKLAAARSAFEYGKYLRLLAYLRHRQPDANVGYSILIFRVAAEEIDWALHGLPVELDEAPWLPQRVRHL